MGIQVGHQLPVSRDQLFATQRWSRRKRRPQRGKVHGHVLQYAVGSRQVSSQQEVVIKKSQVKVERIG